MGWLHSLGGGRGVAATIVVGVGLMAGGCAQLPGVPSEPYAARGTLASYPGAGPMTLAPNSADPAAVGSVARPAVMVEETIVPAPAAKSAAKPLSLAPPARTANAELGPERPPARGEPNLAAPAEQPDGKLLSPEEKAKVIAELEALARSQSAGLGKTKKASDCASQTLKPGQRVASATGGGEC